MAELIDIEVSIDATELSNQLDTIKQALQELSSATSTLDSNVSTLVAEVDKLDVRVTKLEQIKPTPDPDPDPDPGWTPRFAGDVEPGHARWGAAIGGNGNPKTRHEDAVGVPMGVRRTFFGWNHIASGYLVDIVQEDHGIGRVPWVSVKPPSPKNGAANGWASIAAGNHDTELDALLTDLNAQGKPVWLTMHHEPENDGLPAKDWRAMQTKTRERIDAVGATNVAFAGILMSWTYDPRSNRNPADWWVDGEWDFVGIDHYIEKESVKYADPASDTMWKLTTDWIKSKDVPYAIGEWGNRGTDAAAGADVQRLYDAIIADDDFVAACAFDSGLNAPSGSWELKGEQLKVFRAAMKDARSLRI